MIQSKKIIWQIFPASIVTLLIAIVAVAWYSVSAFQEFNLQETESDLESRAILVRAKVLEYLHLEQKEELRRYCIQAGRESATRITVINSAGKVVADSNENPEVMDNHRSRPEVAKAFTGEVGKSRRYSKTLDENRIYLALPLEAAFTQMGKEVAGKQLDTKMVLRTSVSVASLDKTLAGIKLRIGIGALGVMLVASLVTLLISRNISRPLEQMTQSAERFSHGDFGERMLPQVKKTASLEVITLAASMDRMAEELDEKIAAIVSHRNQLETVFSSMVEAVLAIDAEERVISLNDAAADIFSVDKNESCGKLVQAIVRDVKLQQQISHTLTTLESIEDETLFHTSGGERFLQINVVPLNNGGGEQLGVLLVLNDVTRLRRLEKVRRDFVANVSHELRTPITSIRGYVETLLDGALDDRQDSEKFLKIVLRQSVRLTSIIDDLLILSRVEENLRQGEIDLEKDRILPVIEAAVQTCEGEAEKGNISVRYSCDKDCTIPMNAPLLEQAIVNLLVNAITCSTSGSEVFIEVTGGTDDDDPDGFVRITVRDKGCGIGTKHIPRVFERFYRSDRARNSQHGGTGLGLAIVKHISQAHNGSVELKSVEGEGSEFTLVLPG